MQRDARLAGVFLAALSMMLVGSLFAVPYLPTNDGPEWVFASHVENHYGDPGTVYREIFIPALQFASRGFGTVYGPLEAWLGWQRGLQVALGAVALVAAWGFVALVYAVDPRRWPLALLGFPLALSWTFYMGFWSFHLASGLGLFAVALAVRLREPTGLQRAALAALLLLVAVMHVFAAVLSGACVLGVAVAAVPGRRAREARLVMLTGLPAMGVLLACVLVSRGLVAAPLASGFDRFSFRDVLTMLPRTLLPGPLVRALIASAVVLLAAAAALTRSVSCETRGVDRGLGFVAALLLLATLVAPFQIPGWQAFSERFAFFGAAMALATIPLERLGHGATRAVAAALFAGAAASLASSYGLHRRLAALCPDAIAGLTADVHTTGDLLPVTIRATELPTYDRVRAEVPLLSPLLHMATLYAVAHGGTSAYYFTGGPAVYPFELRPGTPHARIPDLERTMRAFASDAFHHDLAYRRQVDSEMAMFGVVHATVVVLGALPEDVALFRDRGFVMDWSRGAAFVAHFEPCAIDLVATGDATASVSIDLRVGELRVLEGMEAAAEARDDGLVHFTVPGSPCGTVDVRAHWGARADGHEPTCRNANSRGEVTGHITHRSGRVRCDLQ